MTGHTFFEYKSAFNMQIYDNPYKVIEISMFYALYKEI